jgi:hypothetical protein
MIPSNNKQTTSSLKKPTYFQKGNNKTSDASNESSEFSDAECEDVDEMIVVSGNTQIN